jgi:hypothetical protein
MATRPKSKPPRPAPGPAPIVLTQEHLERLEAAQRRIVDLAPVLEKLELCGEDCAQYREFGNYLLEQLGLLKQHFFPKAR